MARTCGLCLRALREGDSFVYVRVGAEGATPDFQQKVGRREAVAPGLYSSCPDCAEHVKPHAAERVHKERCKQERIRALVEEREFKEPVKLQPGDLAGNDLM